MSLKVEVVSAVCVLVVRPFNVVKSIEDLVHEFQSFTELPLHVVESLKDVCQSNVLSLFVLCQGVAIVRK